MDGRRALGEGRDRHAALLIGLVTFLLLLPGAMRYGLTWDEPTYFRFADRQRQWFAELGGALAAPSQLSATLSEARIHDVWLQDPRKNGHPPLQETWLALASLPWRALGLSDVRSFRWANALWLGLAAMGLYALLRRAVSRTAAVGGVLAYLGVPAIWAHGHLAATESMQNCFWIWLAVLWPLAFDERLGRARLPLRVAALGAASGLAFLGKFTNLLIPCWLLATAFVLGGWRNARLWMLAPLLLLLAPLSLLLSDPFFWPWQGGGERYLDYLRQAVTRGQWIPINVFYQGASWGYHPPWHYRPVELAVSLPSALLALALPSLAATALVAWRGLREAPLLPAGVERVRRWESWPATLAMSGLAVTFVVGWLPQAPNHDGTRQFVFAFLFLAIAIAHGLDWAERRLSARRAVPRLGLIAGLLALPAWAFGISLAAEPWGLSYHSEWIGGTAGAFRRGFEVSYWGEGVDARMLRRVAELPAERGDTLRVYAVPKLDYFEDAERYWHAFLTDAERARPLLVHDAVPARYEPWVTKELEQRYGLVLRQSFREPPDALLVFMRRATVADDYAEFLAALVAAGDLELVAETKVDGVPLARLYRYLRFRPARFGPDPEQSVWWQPQSIESLLRPGAAGAPAPSH